MGIITRIKKYKNKFIYGALILILLPLYFNREEGVYYAQDTDALITGKILSKYISESDFKSPFGYRYYNIFSDSMSYARLSHNYFALSNLHDLETTKKNTHKFGLWDYDSQVGISGHLYVFLYYKLDPFFDTYKISFSDRLYVLKFFQSIFFSIILFFICLLIYKQYGINWFVAFAVPFLFSAYIPKYANHLGLGFTIAFFLPILLSILSIRYEKKYYYFLPLYVLVFILKAMSGYEFTPTIMLSGLIFPVVNLCRGENKKIRIKYWKMIILISITTFIGFSLGFLYHASLRGDTIIEGLQNIILEDASRRVFIQDGNILKTVIIAFFKLFFVSWTYDYLFYGICGIITFPLMIFLFIKIKLKEFKRKFNFYLLLEPLFFLSISFSWLVLSFDHCVDHYNIMTNIIWFFGTLQYFIYTIVRHYKLLEKIQKIIE